MKPERPLKHFLAAALLAAVCYVVFYSRIEDRRTRKGPWEVVFTQTTGGVPAIVIGQPSLAISNVQVTFPGQRISPTNAHAALVFGQPQPVPFEVPFGHCVFMDTTFLPGTVTFQLFGHEVELLPRVLVIDRQEHPWLSDSTVTLHPVHEVSPARQP